MGNETNERKVPELVEKAERDLVSRPVDTDYVPDFGLYEIPSLGLPTKLAAIEKGDSDKFEKYTYETESEGVDDIPDMSFTFVYNPISNDIKDIVIRIYGGNRDRFMEIGAGAKNEAHPITITYGSYENAIDVTSDEYWFEFNETPNFVRFVYDNKELYYWNKNPAKLKDALQIGTADVREILSKFIDYKTFHYQYPEGELVEGDYNESLNMKYDPPELEIIGHVNRKTKIDFIYKLKNLFPPHSTVQNLGDTNHNYGDVLEKYANAINDPREDLYIQQSLLNSIMKELISWLKKYEKFYPRGFFAKEDPAEESTETPEDFLDFVTHNNIPNLVFMGDPGTGKTVFAKRLAENVLGAKFYAITGGGLKGAFEGQTAGTVIETFKKLREDIDERKPAVLFIDEAYILFNHSPMDDYSSEVIEILLKAMEPGERTLTAKIAQGTASPTVEFKLYGNTAVWMGGYEKEMRKALSVNPGMFRRTRTIVLERPGYKDLWNKFNLMMGRDSEVLDPTTNEINKEYCKKNEKLICDYFKWARSKTYAEFFGNYAGVQRLVEEIEKTSLLMETSLADRDNLLEEIIDQQKSDIRTQYLRVIEENYPRLPFTVYTDVKEKLKEYIGAESAKEKIRRVINMIVNPKKYPNCVCPKGALLVGPPGTGKTYLARCMAGELAAEINGDNRNETDVAFIKVAATELQNSDLVRALFSTSEGYDNVIVFIDEIDAIGKKRSTYSDNSVLVQLLNELDGFDGKNNIFVLAATNVPEQLDPALVRPGRFDTTIEIGLPNSKDRIGLVKFYLKGIVEPDDFIKYVVDSLHGHSTIDKKAILKKALSLYKKFIKNIADSLRGYSPIEIKTILNEALILYRDCEDKINDPDTKKIASWFVHRITHEEPSSDEITTVTIEGKKVMVSQKLSDENKDNSAKDTNKNKDSKAKNSDAGSDKNDGNSVMRSAGINQALFLIDFAEVLAQREIGERSMPINSKKKFSTEKNDGGPSSTAVHEVGHALVKVLYGIKFKKITILSRGKYLGYVENSDETHPVTKKDYLDQIDACFGGRAAEELIYGADEISSGASQDIIQASSIARTMVMELGMNEKVGPMALEMTYSRYLGDGNQAICSESTLASAEQEIRKLLKERYSATVEMLRSHIKDIENLANLVYQKEEVSYEEFLKLCKNNGIITASNN